MSIDNKALYDYMAASFTEVRVYQEAAYIAKKNGNEEKRTKLLETAVHDFASIWTKIENALLLNHFEEGNVRDYLADTEKIRENSKIKLEELLKEVK